MDNVEFTHQHMQELLKENSKLKDELTVLQGKERELRGLIAYLNNLGPKPDNLNP